MKKINRLTDPFLHCAIVDILGMLSIFTILGMSGYVYSHPFTTLIIAVPILIAVLFRAMWTSVSISMMKQLEVLRRVAFNINVDIKVSREIGIVFSQRDAYEQRKKLLVEKKKKVRAVYLEVVKLMMLFWKKGYNADALLFVLNALIPICDDIERLCVLHDGKTKIKKIDRH